MTAEIDVKRYDRQIRLWGLDTQRGLQSARVLLLRATGLCNEIAKNLVLAGVGHVTIQDPSTLTAADLSVGALFSVSASSVGTNKAEALASGLRALNPAVDIASTATEVSAMDAEFLSAFNYVIGTNALQTLEEICECTNRFSAAAEPEGRASKRPRSAEDAAPRAESSNGAHVTLPPRATEQTPKMLAAGALGLFGFCALDLGSYSYAPAPKVAADTDAADKEAPITKYLITFPSIEQAFSVEWQAMTNRVPRIFCALQLLRQAPAGADAAKVESLRTERLHAAGLSEDFLRDPLTSDFVSTVFGAAHAQVPAVCAILGGLVAAEVVKLIGGKEPPINNVLLFDATTPRETAGVVVRLGPSFQMPWGRDSGQPRREVDTTN
uniref:THIF-type NAD/FAD binding fold domain-containing protein n=1 Tax=Chrysotila carterae TaxID=13221 RepID=A0A6T0ECP7_CHRCT